MLATVLRPEATPDSRAWRRLRRRTLDAAEELAATFDVLRREPRPGRVARRLVQAAVQLEMKPQDTLLFDLDRRPADDARGFLSKRSLTRLEDTLNPAAHHHLVGNKLDYHVACAARGVAAPPVLAVIDLGPDDGRRARLGAARIGGEADLAAFLGSPPDATRRLVFKAFEGSYGRGLLAVTVGADGAAVGADGRRLAPAAILRHCHAHRAAKGFLVQTWLEPDPALRPLMPGRALGTVRVVTVLVGGDQVRVPYAFVKIPVGANVSDAFDHGRTGNLLAAVDVADGTVGPAWGPSPTRPRRLEARPAHPDTGAAVEGFRIPRWPEVLRAVSRGARAFPELRTLGWDVAITTAGVFLLEGNHHWDPHGPQVTLQRGIGREMEALAAQAGGQVA
jgi:Sugar-transfer associated ATP-grasp